MQDLDRFAQEAVKVMMNAAVDWCHVHGNRPTDEQIDRLDSALRERTDAAIAEGLRDAREAHEAGMVQVVPATFLASMRTAGIEAARAVFAQ